MSVVLYGMPPTNPWLDPGGPRIEPLPYYPPATGAGEIAGRQTVVGPTAPEGASAVRARIETRIAWLKNELRMHETWREELALLEKMLAATTPVPNEGTEQKESNG